MIYAHMVLIAQKSINSELLCVYKKIYGDVSECMRLNLVSCRADPERGGCQRLVGVPP